MSDHHSRTVDASLLLFDDAAAAAADLAERLRDAVRSLGRRGAVLGLSGGVDSSVVAALAVQALGRERVLAVLMPERESSVDTLPLSRAVADALEIDYVVEDITAPLEALGAYERRDEAIRTVIPEYGPGWVSKLVLPSLLESRGYRLTSLVARAPDGEERTVRLPPEAYRQVVAATNFKQRVRKMLEYYHADRRHFAVLGTPNRLEFDQGFFVKQGDGAADVKPIAHLFKSQVYQLAAVLGLPDEVRSRPSTTDTFPMEQSQEEFYFSLPLEPLDLCLYALDHGLSAAEVGPAIGLDPEQVERVFDDIAAKRRVASYLHAAPLTCSPHDDDETADA
jgi:NAD+ synthase